MSTRTNPEELSVATLGVQHGEKRDERLVTGFNEQDSERVIVKRNSFEGLGDWRKDGSSSN